DVLSTFHEQAPFAGEEDQGSAVREGSGPRAAAPAEESAPDQSFVPEALVSGLPSLAGPGDEPAAPALPPSRSGARRPSTMVASSPLASSPLAEQTMLAPAGEAAGPAEPDAVPPVVPSGEAHDRGEAVVLEPP